MHTALTHKTPQSQLSLSLLAVDEDLVELWSSMAVSTGCQYCHHSKAQIVDLWLLQLTAVELKKHFFNKAPRLPDLLHPKEQPVTRTSASHQLAVQHLAMRLSTFLYQPVVRTWTSPSWRKISEPACRQLEEVLWREKRKDWREVEGRGWGETVGNGNVCVAISLWQGPRTLGEDWGLQDFSLSAQSGYCPWWPFPDNWQPFV